MDSAFPWSVTLAPTAMNPIVSALTTTLSAVGIGAPKWPPIATRLPGYNHVGVLTHRSYTTGFDKVTMSFFLNNQLITATSGIAVNTMGRKCAPSMHHQDTSPPIDPLQHWFHINHFLSTLLPFGAAGRERAGIFSHNYTKTWLGTSLYSPMLQFMQHMLTPYLHHG
jgi:hypothetical protein